MQLVVLAAGHGRRFGGLKQLAAVGPSDEAIMDYTARDALAAGFDAVLLVVRTEVEAELADHVRAYWPTELKVDTVVQGPVAGTAQAVVSARPLLAGPFGVANADDLYGASAFVALARGIRDLEAPDQLLVGYRLRDTVITDAPVTRGVCSVGGDGYLALIDEKTVERQADGTFSALTAARGRASPAGQAALLTGDEQVSMNLWGFSEPMLDELDASLDAFDPKSAPHVQGKPPEVLLPDVVARLVTSGRARVRVVPSGSRCIGITHPDDLPLVRKLVGEQAAGQ